MLKTSKEVENYLTPLYKLLHFPLSTPKWVGLRFLINISLSLKQEYEIGEFVLDGKEYRLDQITGKNKDDEDFTNLYKQMIEVYEKIEIKTTHQLEKRLEYHIQRGYMILSKSLKSNSNIYEFLYHEF